VDIRTVEGRPAIPDHSGSASAWYMIERNELQTETEETHLEYVCEFEIAAGRKLERHYHNNFEFFYVLTGEGAMEIEGEEQAVGPGSLIKIGPNQVHSIWSTVEGEPIRCFCFGLNLEKDGTSGYQAA
jgi:quercetin dioxygenase-like cupin family protein